MKDLRRLPWTDILTFCAVLAVHLSFAVSLVASNVLYLGGDTTRDAWRALTLLSSGRLTREFGVPFESDLYCLAFVPFIALFKNTVLTLQVSGIAFTTATVAVLFGYVRRAWGLLPAICLGMIYACSPLLLAHAALNPAYSVPLYLGVILLLETARSPRAPYVQTALAGFFASLHPYFLFPYFGYLIGKTGRRDLDTIRREPAAAARHALLFLAGFSPLLLKMAAARTAGDTRLAAWTATFLNANSDRWKDIPGILHAAWSQLSWGMSSFIVYRAAEAPAPLTPLFLLWVFLWGMSFFLKDSRRWAVTLAAGLIPAAFIASPGGLGMRHLLCFLPFYWLMLPPFLLRLSNRRGRYLLCLVAATAVMQYVPVNLSFRRAAAPEGAAVLRDTGRVKDLLASYPGQEASLYSDNSNLFFDLRFLVPGKELRLCGAAADAPPLTALLVLNDPVAGEGRVRLSNLGTYHVSGRTACTVLGSRPRFLDFHTRI